MPTSTQPLTASDAERTRTQTIVRRGHIAARIQRRAHVLLKLANGRGVSVAAARAHSSVIRLRVKAHRVRACRSLLACHGASAYALSAAIGESGKGSACGTDDSGTDDSGTDDSGLAAPFTRASGAGRVV